MIFWSYSRPLKRRISPQIIVLMLLYGYSSAVFSEACKGKDAACALHNAEAAYIIVARTTGKAITGCFFLGMVFVLRPVIELMDRLTYSEKELKWRRLHSWLMISALLLSIIHTAAHIRRRSINSGEFWFEELKLWTGCVLFLLFAVMGTPFIFSGTMVTMVVVVAAVVAMYLCKKEDINTTTIVVVLIAIVPPLQLINNNLPHLHVVVYIIIVQFSTTHSILKPFCLTSHTSPPSLPPPLHDHQLSTLRQHVLCMVLLGLEQTLL